MFGAFVGATAGVFIRCWANALGKQRYLARPWNHLFLGGIGAFVGTNYTTWEKNLLADLNEKRKEKGLVEITRQDLTVFNK